MKKDKAFTFVETLIVLAIVLIMGAGVGISGATYIERARKIAADNQIAVFSNALHTYYLDCGVFPSEHQGLLALWEKPEFHPVPQNWQGPYVDRQPGLDPWETDYVYMDENEAGLSFSVLSFGADRQEGGEGKNADIYSWK